VLGCGVRAVTVAPDQVATVGWAECPGQLELTEAEQEGDPRRLVRPRRGYCVPVLIAYWLGEIGTIGSLIWLIRLISFVHWPGWRMLPATSASFLLAP